MLLRRLAIRARLAAAEALKLARHVIRPPDSSLRIDVAILEDRVLLSAAPLDTELSATRESGIESIEGNGWFDEVRETWQSLDLGDHILTSPRQPADGWQGPALQRHDVGESLSPFASPSHELVFVDDSVKDHQQLVADLLANSHPERELEVYLLDSSRDGVAQISKRLAGHSEVDAVHLVSHGTEGQVKLGNIWLHADNLDSHAGDIARWNDALRDGADLLIYGCDLAGSDHGRALSEALGVLCHCDVAASIDDTGHAALGGDWDLEFVTGVIETGVAFSADLQNRWNHVMALETVRDEFSAESYGNDDGSVAWAGNWTETDSLGGGAAAGQINVDASGRLMISTASGSESIYREVDLSAAVWAQLTYDVDSQLSGDTVRVEIYDGSWHTLVDYSSAVVGTETFDITPYRAADTQLRISSLSNGNETLYLDNIQIDYDDTQAPGGVDASLNLWLRADAGVITSGADVDQWNNQVATSPLTEVSASGTNRPTLNASTLNFHPVISFDGIDDDLSANSVLGSTLFSSNGSSIYTVASLNNTGDVILQWRNDNPIGNANRVNIEDQLRFDFGDLIGDSHTAPSPPAGYHILNAVASPATSPVKLWFNIDGQPTAPDDASGDNPVNVNNTGKFTLGDYPLGGYAEDVDLGEVIIFGSELTPGEQARVDSYLAVKYGITLDQTAATNYVDSQGNIIWDAAANTIYNNDIAGIGRDLTSTLDQSQSKSINSDAIVTMSAASNQHNGEFLIWGNDDGALVEVAGEPAGVANRLARIWRVAETGDVGPTTIAFDLNGLTYTGTTAADFKLIVDTDADFSSGASTIAATSYNGASKIVTFTGTKLADGQFFALGTELSPNTAPVLADTIVNLNSVDEDAGFPAGPVGTPVSSLVDFPGGGGQDNVTDADGGSVTGIAVTAADTSSGSWHYSTDGGAVWNPLGAVAVANARLLAANLDAWIYFQPNADYNGTVTPAITFHAWDQTSGINGGTADLTTGPATTVLDQFNSQNYNLNNGTASWSGPWTETDDTPLQDAGGGVISINNGELDLQPQALGYQISRQVNLSGAAWATLSLSYDNQLSSGDVVEIQVSADGGTSYVTRESFSDSVHTGIGTRTIDLTPFIATNTKVRFLVTSPGSPAGHLFLDNIGISYGGTAAGGTTAFSSETDTASITVNPVNDAPQNNIPGNQILMRDTSLAFSAANSNLISIADTDAGGGALEVTLTAANGTLTLSTIANLSFSTGTGTGDPAMTFTGLLADINNAIDGLTFDPTPSYAGSASVQIDVDDQGSTGIGPAGMDTGLINIGIITGGLWVSSEGDVSGSAAPGLASWDDGQVVQIADPNLSFGLNNSDGTFATGFDLDSFVSGADIDALHLVGKNITVGRSTTVPLLAGDVIFSTKDNETLPDVGAILDEDLLVFRPTTAGNYSAGTFMLLLNHSSNTNYADFNLANVDVDDILGFSLIEVDTIVGGELLEAGTMLFSMEGGSVDNRVYHLIPDDVGAGNASGTVDILVNGADIGVSKKVFGIELVEETTTLPGMTLPAGTVLITLDADDNPVGSGPTANSEQQDIIRLDVTSTSFANGTTVAGASIFFDGSYIGLTQGSETLDALALPSSSFNSNSRPVLDLDANDNSGAVGNDYQFTFTEGDAPTAIGDVDTNLTDLDSTAFDHVMLVISGLLDGNAETLLLDGSSFALATAEPGQDTAGLNYHLAITTGGGTAGVTITKQGGGQFDETEAETLIKAIQYQHTDAADPTVGNRLIDVVVNDGSDDSAAARTTINVNPANDPPALVTNTGLTLAEHNLATITNSELLVNDVDNTALEIRYTVTANTIHGRLQLSGANLDTADTFTQDDIDNNRLTFVHDGSENPSDSFSFTVADGAGGTLGAKVFNITITSVNDDPLLVHNAGLVSGTGTTATITTDVLEVRDDDNAPVELTYTLTALPVNGTLQRSAVPLNLFDSFTQNDIDNNLITYVHDGSLTVSDLFTFTVDDGAGGFLSATDFQISIYDGVWAQDDADVTDEQTVLNIAAPGVLVNDLNVDADPVAGINLNYDAVLDGDGDNLWQDSTGASGFDWNFGGTGVVRTTSPTTSLSRIGAAYLFDASGGGVASAMSTLPGNPSQVAASFEIWFNPTDAVGQEVLFETGTSFAGSSFTLNGGVLEFKVDDGAASALASADISARIAANEFIQVVGVIDLDSPVADLYLYVDGVLVDSVIDVAGLSDWDGGFQAGLGAVSGLINSTNTGNYEGEIAIFRFYQSALAAGDVQDNFNAIAAAGLTVTGLDTSGTLGSVTLNPDGSLSYDPHGQFESLAIGEIASDSFLYTVSDGVGNSDTATVTITINGINDMPVAVDDGYSVDEDTGLNVAASGVLANDTDPDASDLLVVLSVDTTGTVGVVVLNPDGSLSYDPNGLFTWLAAGDSTTDSFRYTLDDGNGGTGTATVTITINGVNDTPTAVDDTYLTDEATVLNVAAAGVLANDSDRDSSDLLAVQSVDTAGTIGLVTLNADGSLSYDPQGAFEWLAVGESTTDSFRYTIDDGNGGTDTATVTVTIDGVNDAPLASGETYGIGVGLTLGVVLPGLLANDSDIDGDPLIVILVTAPADGDLTINNDGTFNYTPHPGFIGLDSFSYVAHDGSTNSNIATVSINVFVPPPMMLPIPTEPPVEDPVDTDRADAPADSILPAVLAPVTGVDPTTRHASVAPRRRNEESSAPAPVLVAERTAHDEHSPLQPVLYSSPRKASTAGDNETDSSASEHFRLRSNADPFWNHLDELRQRMEADAQAPNFVIGSAAGVTSMLSAGYVMWLVRGGHILAGLMAQLPAWQLIDPLPILAQRESDDEGDEDDSLAALVETERDEADDKTEVMKDVTPASSNDNSARWMNDQ